MSKRPQTSLHFRPGELSKAHRRLFSLIVRLSPPSKTRARVLEDAIEMVGVRVYGSEEAVSNVLSACQETEEIIAKRNTAKNATDKSSSPAMDEPI
jgi:hypothetical protein